MPRANLERQVTVITGASGGIGRATAHAFATRGAIVVLAARRAEALEEVARECREIGAADVLAVPLDVADADAAAALAHDTVSRFGRIDVWVNNAAVVLYGRAEEVPDNVWRRVIETNLFGAYHGARAALPWFREQGSGVLVNVSSILGKAGSPFQSAYVASKHAVRALSDSVRQEVVDADDIHVCTVLPGPVDTPLFRSGANYTGWRVVPPGAPVDPARVAAGIIRCATQPTREVVVGASTRAGLLVTRIAPALAESVAARAISKVHFDKVPSPRTEGNVFAPLEEAGRVDDRWRDEKVRRSKGALLTVAGLTGAAIAVALTGRPIRQ